MMGTVISAPLAVATMMPTFQIALARARTCCGNSCAVMTPIIGTCTDSASPSSRRSATSIASEPPSGPMAMLTQEKPMMTSTRLRLAPKRSAAPDSSNCASP